LLEKNGFIVDWVKNKADAIHYFADHSPDLALLDLHLGSSPTDGFRAAEQIRKTHLQVPFVFLTSYTEGKNAVRGLEFDRSDFIRKDTGKDELIARIKKCLREYPVSEEQQRIIKITPDTSLDLINNAIVSYGQVQKITPKELHLLQLLLKHKNIPQERKWIVDQLWPDEKDDRVAINLKKANYSLREALKPDKRIELIVKQMQSITLVVKDC